MSRQSHVRRVALLCGASLLTVAAAASPSGALAQDARTNDAQSDEATTVDEVIRIRTGETGNAAV